MARYSLQGWDFCFDSQKTKDRSQAFPKSVFGLSGAVSGLDELAEQLGLDLERPAFCAGEGKYYLFYGTARSESGYELDFYGPDCCLSVVVYPCPEGYREDGLEIQEPCVLLGLFGV